MNMPNPLTAVFLIGALSSAGAGISLETAPPVVVKTVPAAGATNVDPGLTELRVTYSKAMQDGSWSWSTWSEENFPEMTGDPRYLSDGRTCVLPVKLEPNKFYAIWLNSQKFDKFKDTEGRPAVPYLLTFITSGQSLDAGAATAQGYEYVARRGDTLTAIVQAYRGLGIQVTVDDVVKANPGLTPTGLTAGQTIIIPTKSGSPSRNPADLRFWVEDFFAHNYRDFTSRETLEWGDVKTNANGCVSIRYKYHARVWDKETVTKNQVFTFEPDGSFVSVKDVYDSPEERMKALVEKFFTNNYRDITSRETIEWGDVESVEDGNTAIRYEYQAKIWGKETVLKNQVFTFGPDDTFISVRDAAMDEGE